MSVIQKKKPTPSQKASTTQKSSPHGKVILKKPSLVSKASSYSGLQKKPVAKRGRELEEEDEEDWEEVDELEQAVSYHDDEAEEADESEEDEYSRLESEEELEIRQSPNRSKKKLVSTSKPPPKKVNKPSHNSWWDVIKKGVERIPLFSALEL